MTTTLSLDEVGNEIVRLGHQIPKITKNQPTDTKLEKQLFSELDRLAELIHIYREQGQSTPRTDELYKLIRGQPDRLRPEFIHAPFLHLLESLQDVLRSVTPEDKLINLMKAFPSFRPLVNKLMNRCDRQAILNQVTSPMCQTCVRESLPEFWNQLMIVFYEQAKLLLLESRSRCRTETEALHIAHEFRHVTERWTSLHHELANLRPEQPQEWIKAIEEAMWLMVQLMNATQVELILNASETATHNKIH